MASTPLYVNGYTHEIANKLHVSLRYAQRVQQLMEASSLDFSECENEEFDAAMHEARRALRAQRRTA